MRALHGRRSRGSAGKYQLVIGAIAVTVVGLLTRASYSLVAHGEPATTTSQLQAACPVCPACPKQWADSHGKASEGEQEPSKNNPFEITLDIRDVVGEPSALDGVAWQPHVCIPSWKASDETLAPGIAKKFEEVLEREIKANVARKETNAPAGSSLCELSGLPPDCDIPSDTFVALRETTTRVAATFALRDGTWVCACGRPSEDVKKVSSVGDMAKQICPLEEAVKCIGSYPGDHLRYNKTAAGLADSLMKHGNCFVSGHFMKGFARFLIEERLQNPEYRTFATGPGPELPGMDTVLELFDIMFEKKPLAAQQVFLRQRWLGHAMMQDGFDLLAIQNIIWDLRPDVILETGTASGGSALLWANILELAGLHDSRIYTVDTVHPSEGFKREGKEEQDPTRLPIWDKYVTFLQGHSDNPKVLKAMEEAAQGASTVLVLLDSDHGQGNVGKELRHYCKWVTLGSYCIAEDTKLSRMNGDGGPLEAVREFMKGNKEFKQDRERELMYSQHPGGYLKRTALPEDAAA